jgi:UDP-N-acetylmuramate dehydrogenase
MMAAQFTSLAAELSARGIRAQTNVSMATRTTYGVGGPAACLATVTVANLDALVEVLSGYPRMPVLVVGRGSNLLVSDDGFAGVVISLVDESESVNLYFDDSGVVASASVPMPVLARRSAAAGRTGLEWCVGIPGSVGAAVRMNAGGHGADMQDSLVEVTVTSLQSGKTVDVSAADVGLHFRGSALAAHHLVLKATFSTQTIDPETASATVDSIVTWRRDNQPGGRNAGSVFVNPAPDNGSAGALIDAAGLRGYSVGAASVSEKHANFIQAKTGATANDIIEVMTHVQARVEEVHGVRMRSEVVLVGFANDVTSRFSDPRHAEPDRVEAAQRLAVLMGDLQ